MGAAVGEERAANPRLISMGKTPQKAQNMGIFVTVGEVVDAPGPACGLGPAAGGFRPEGWRTRDGEPLPGAPLVVMMAPKEDHEVA